MSYDFTNDAGLDKEECEWLTRFCGFHEFKTVLEFGPGNSTQAMLDGGVPWIVSYEHEAEYACVAMKIFEAYSDRVQIVKYDAMKMPIVPKPECLKFDFAFIDGPPGRLTIPPRLNAALFCFSRAPIIAIHDCFRDSQLVSILEDIGMVHAALFASKRGIVVLRHT